MASTPSRPPPRRRVVGLATGTDSPPALLAQLCAEYPEVSRRAVSDALNLALAAASAPEGCAENSRDRVAAFARDRLGGVRTRSAAAAHRRERSPGPSGQAHSDGGPGVVRRPVAGAHARGGTMDVDGLSRFDRLFEVILENTATADVSADSLCQAAAAHLGVAAAAVSVPDGLVAAQTVGAAGPLARQMEELQVLLGEGPSLDGLTGARRVVVADLAAPAEQDRWPMFAPTAADAGVGSMVVLPMRVGAARFGVFVAYLDRPGGLDSEALSDAQDFAAIALKLLLDRAAASARPPRAAEASSDESDPADARRPFFDDRPEIHQATGMVSVQLDVDLASALLRIRARAFADGRELSALAADVVARKVTFHGADE